MLGLELRTSRNARQALYQLAQDYYLGIWFYKRIFYYQALAGLRRFWVDPAGPKQSEIRLPLPAGCWG